MAAINVYKKNLTMREYLDKIDLLIFIPTKIDVALIKCFSPTLHNLRCPNTS
jgi:hypothetical protein